jgi:ElaB/YqjD/DUF883 family membrane-anchored ribosome-binding protein
LWLFIWRMSSLKKKPGVSAKSVKKVAKRAAKGAGSALAVVARRVPSSPRVVKQARAALKGLPSRTRSFVKRNPVRVLLGASAIGLVLAKLRQLV